MRSMTRAIAAALAALAALLPTTALADHVRCGDVLTQDTTLDSDVICDGDPYFGQEITGLVIGADDITLDLDGHVVQVIPGFAEADEVNGILDDGTPRNGLRILNGSVLDFSQGISLRTSDTLIRGVVADGTIGMILRGDRNVVTRSAPDGGFAALRTSGDGNQVLRNRITSYEGEGIVARGRDVRIVRNEIRVEPAGFFPGIEVSAFANALVDRNDVFSGRSDGILLFDGAGAAVTRNRAHDSLYGIRVAATASNVLLRDNHADRNGYSGILVDSPSTTITRNTANDNGTYWPDDPTGGYGIEAVAGVTDGGKNRATGNARPEQCLNVRCR